MRKPFSATRRHGPTDDYDYGDPYGGEMADHTVPGRPGARSHLEEHEGWTVGGAWFDDLAAAKREAARTGGRVMPGLTGNPFDDNYFTRKIGDATIHIRPVDGRDWIYEGSIELPDGTRWEFDELGAPKMEHGRRSEDDEDLIDEMAASAVSFGSYYTTHNRGYDVPEWAPEADLADEISSATEWASDDSGKYEVKRVNPSRKIWGVREGYIACEKCRGTGDDGPGVCSTCKGRGIVPIDDGPIDVGSWYTPHGQYGTRKNPAGLTAKGERMYGHVKASYAGDPRAKEIAARTVYARVGGGAKGLKKNPNPGYKWFIISPKGILSGWEYMEDARDDLRENGNYYAAQVGGPVTRTSRRTLMTQGIDPDKKSSWWMGNGPLR